MQLGVPHLHCLYDFLSVRLSVCLTLCLTDFVSVWQTVCLTSLQLSVCLTISVWHSVYLTFCLSEFISVCPTESDQLFDCLGACLSGWLGAKLPGCLSVILLMFWTTFVLITRLNKSVDIKGLTLSLWKAFCISQFAIRILQFTIRNSHFAFRI